MNRSRPTRATSRPSVSDLTHNRPSLIYSYRVGTLDRRSAGRLCLVFRFEDELRSIFRKLTQENPYIALELLDQDGQVIASSSPYHVPVGSILEARNSPTHQTYYAGFEYLYKAVKTTGYQGYTGPGWIGHAMVPMHLAFRSSSHSSLSNDPMFDKVANTTEYFPQELKDILDKAKKIQTELDITVWNGNVQIANASNKENPFTKALLGEISKTGEETKKVFEQTVTNLNTAMLERYLEDLRFQSSLAIDIMDRNLYERANDCRWWALTTTFREYLAQHELAPEERSKMGSILQYINSLCGLCNDVRIRPRRTIEAVSNLRTSITSEESGTFMGHKRPSPADDRNISSRNSNRAPFTTMTTPTFTTPASAILPEERPAGSGSFSIPRPQFQAMLDDILPKNEEGEIKEGMFALFVDRRGRVLSSTDESIEVGSTIALGESVLNLPCGRSHAQMIAYNGLYYALGATCSSGYREYKHSDGYRNDIIAVLFRPIGECTMAQEETQLRREYVYPKPSGLEETCEISTFFIGNTLFAVESKEVVCSLMHQELTPILHASEYNLGVIGFDKRMVSVISLAKLMGMEKKYDKERDTIIVVKADIDGQLLHLGLAVDAIFSGPGIRCVDRPLQVTSSKTRTR